MQQNLKVLIVFSVTMLVVGSSGWLLCSYMVEIICPITFEIACVNKDPIFDVVLFLVGPQISTYSRIYR